MSASVSRQLPSGCDPSLDMGAAILCSRLNLLRILFEIYFRSRAVSGWLHNMPTSMECMCRSAPVRAQSASCRRRVEPLALVSVARRPRHGVSSHRNRRRVASTRTVSAGEWPGPSARGGSHRSITRATSSKMLRFSAALLVREQQMGTQAATATVKPAQPKVVVKTAL